MNRQLIEIASWNIVSQLHERYPDKFTVIETHPGGGQYDCLSLYNNELHHIADLNRRGRFHVFRRFDNTPPTEPFDIWEKMFNYHDMERILNKVSDMLGLVIPSELPETTPTTLVYNFIAVFLNHSMFGFDNWECRNGFIDTSGYGGGVSKYFDNFQVAENRLKVKIENSFPNDPAYRFWFICKNRKPMLCLETVGTIYDLKGSARDLLDIYKGKGSIWLTITEVAGDLLP